MTAVLNLLARYNPNFSQRAGQYILDHKWLGYILSFIVVPILVLAVVTLGTVLISVPAAFIFGWI